MAEEKKERKERESKYVDSVVEGFTCILTASVSRFRSMSLSIGAAIRGRHGDRWWTKAACCF